MLYKHSQLQKIDHPSYRYIEISLVNSNFELFFALLKLKITLKGSPVYLNIEKLKCISYTLKTFRIVFKFTLILLTYLQIFVFIPIYLNISCVVLLWLHNSTTTCQRVMSIFRFSYCLTRSDLILIHVS